jgi:hypothetical protein
MESHPTTHANPSTELMETLGLDNDDLLPADANLRGDRFACLIAEPHGDGRGNLCEFSSAQDRAAEVQAS